MKTAALCEDVLLRVEESDAGLAPSRGSEAATSQLTTVLREDLAGLAEQRREELIDSLASNAETVKTQQPHQLAESLRQIREALRERFPNCESIKDSPRGLRAESVLAIDDESFYIHGWGYDARSRLAALSALSPSGRRFPLLPKAFRHAHPDVDGFYASSVAPRESGFICLIESTGPQPLSDGWLVQSRSEEGEALEARAPAIVRDARTVRKTILEHLRFEPAGRGHPLIEPHVFPAIVRLQDRIASAARVADDFNCGAEIAKPDVSLVVPLFERIDLIEHQLVQFANDTQLKNVEVIYVLDSPEMASETREKVEQLCGVYRLSLRLVTLAASGGFAAACNAGVSQARGRLVMLMHSDVVPDRPGWLGEMINLYDAADAPGAVGAKLLYHDDSIQHAGYAISEAGRVKHPLKGLHRSVVTNDATDAVSAAAMLIDASIFRDAGGFNGGYVDGHLEDVDLCLRLVQAGYENLLANRSELYHLEGQSRSSAVRELAEPYNQWLFVRRWAARRKDAPP